jgi:hypothetical protein
LAGVWIASQTALARYDAWLWQEAVREAKNVSNLGGGQIAIEKPAEN